MNPELNKIYTGDCVEVMKNWPENFVQTVVSSPPYWGLRDYGVPGQIGLEETPESYVAKMVQVFREVKRVLRDDGTLWLNLGDSYCGGGNYRGVNEETLTEKQRSNHGAHGELAIGRNGPPVGLRIKGLKSKDLVGIPWRVAFALQADGWYLRSDIIWAKPNPMPESVTDRPTKAHEYLFLMAKSERYYYDIDSIKEDATPGTHTTTEKSFGGQAAGIGVIPTGNQIPGKTWSWSDKRNKRSVWTISTQPYSEAHFATFPPDLIKPCILAGSKAGDIVLDPFMGAGTTALVASHYDRKFIGTELNPQYVALTESRIANETAQIKMAI